MKPVILIDNGHGMETPGKRSPDAMKGLITSPYWMYEYMWCRKAANACCDILQARGYDAALLVPEQRDIALQERVRRANDMCTKLGTKNVLLVSIHNNASGNGSQWMKANGWSIWTTRGITDADRLAESIHAAARLEFKSPQKVLSYSNTYLGRDFEENFYILKNTYCPAVLVENFFQDNKDDVAFIKSDRGFASCVHVITTGIENYIRTR